jgi:outer membrane lipoprotein carrier protein
MPGRFDKFIPDLISRKGNSVMPRWAYLSGLVLILLALGAPPGWGALTPQEVIGKVQGQYDRSGAFKAYFRQESRLKAVHQGETAEGWMYFQKPCRMRWQYERPTEQKKDVVSDGRQVWMYMPQDRLVMVYQLDQVLRSDLVMRFFSGIGQVRQDFDISWNRPPVEGANYVIDLFPKKPQPELKRLTLTVNPRTFQLENLEFTNALGEETRFAFSRIQLDIKVAPDFFHFTPPPGVQVVQEGGK